THLRFTTGRVDMTETSGGACTGDIEAACANGCSAANLERWALEPSLGCASALVTFRENMPACFLAETCLTRVSWHNRRSLSTTVWICRARPCSRGVRWSSHTSAGR